MKLKHIINSAALSALMLGTGTAFAAGTTAGTNVPNTASVDYTVGGINQTDVNSNTVTFVVDRRINLTVAEVSGNYTDSTPGSTAQVLTFTVTNSTNAVQDFRLSSSNDATGVGDAFGGTDDFDPTGVQIFADSNANGVYDAGVDTATFLDEIPADATRTVFIVADIPIGQTNLQTAGLTLTATAAQPGTAGTLGADSTQTAGAESPGVVDTVFGDGSGDTDAARDGQHSDDDAYRVITATISVVKTATVISDPFNGTTLPKAIPGAVIEYCIQITNTGGTTATAVTANDTVPANTTFVSGSIFAGGTVTGGVCNADGTAEDNDAAGADETDPNGGSIAAGVVTTTVPSLGTATTTASRFRVTIN